MKKVAFVTLVAPLLAAAPALAQQDGNTSRGSNDTTQITPGYTALAAGNLTSAQTALEQDSATATDPARLINLGYIYMRAGRAAEARAIFERVRTAFDPVEVELANGEVTDTHVIARRALARLHRTIASR
jgi:Flp pilus assembly protein TadD